ncbi:MAG: hypothetical protein QW840_01310 [Candidatus Bathyarchaeia archaeon]
MSSEKSLETAMMNHVQCERAIRDAFRKCPFCENAEMEFDWVRLVPRRMTCKGCGASWEPLMNFDGSWTLVAAKLVSVGENGKGKELLNKMQPKDFWEEQCRIAPKEKASMSAKESAQSPEKVVLLREVVKIRCPYCGGLYDEVESRCPHCFGKR